MVKHEIKEEFIEFLINIEDKIKSEMATKLQAI